MRLILVDYALAHHALKRGGEAQGVTLEESRVLSPGRAPKVLEVHEALDEMAKVNERKGKVIEMRYFGMEREEIATAPGGSHSLPSSWISSWESLGFGDF